MPTFYIPQFGCRATRADGAAIERQLLDRGCTLSDSPATADVVLLNTCTVTSAADTQARDAIRKLHTSSPATRIIVTGCYAQRAPEEIAALPGVSFVVGNSHKPQILDLISPPAARIATSPDFISLHALIAASAPVLTGDLFDQQEVLVAPVLGGEGN